MQKSTIALLLCLAFQLTTVVAQQSVSLADKYKFRLGITYEISAGKKNDLKKSQDMSLWYSDLGYTGFGLKGNTAMFMVYDLKTMKLITLMEAQKMAMVIDMKRMGDKMANEENKDKIANAKVTKTGKKETILGYKCEQYQVVSDESESLVWITTELGAGFGDFAKSMAAAMNGARMKNAGGISLPDIKELGNGVMLKMESTNKSSGEVAVIVATNVDKAGKEFNTSGYKMMSLPGQ